MKAVAAIGFAFLAMLVSGLEDYRDEVREREAYCYAVKTGEWPDYRGTYATECPAEHKSRYK